MTTTTSCSVLIPSGPRRRSRVATLAIASAVLALAACGGSDQQFTRDSVSVTMTAQHRAQLKGGATMDPLDCVMDGDQYHWKCLSYVRQGDRLFRFSTNVTCDGDTGECISEPQALTPA